MWKLMKYFSKCQILSLVSQIHITTIATGKWHMSIDELLELNSRKLSKTSAKFELSFT